MKRETVLFIIVMSLLNSFALSAQSLGIDSGELAQVSFQDAIRFRESGKILEAERSIDQALQEFPNNAAYKFELSNVYAAYHDRLRKEKKYQDAQQMLWKVANTLEQTVMLNESDIPAQYNLAVVYKRLGEYEKARERMRHVIDQAKAQGQSSIEFNAFLQMGSIYEDQGFFYEAKEMYTQARELDYYNLNAQAALDDLKRNEEEYKQRSDRNDMFDYARRNRLEFSPNSHAFLQQRRSDESGNLGQAIPFLGAMLVEQFLNRMGKTGSEESQ